MTTLVKIGSLILVGTAGGLLLAAVILVWIAGAST